MSWFTLSCWFFLLCCAYALGTFSVHWRWRLRGAASRLDGAAEVLGHPVHSLSMSYMLLVMLGVVPAFIASVLWIGCFLGCATFFGLRLLLGRARARSWRLDAFAMLLALGMAYMWTDPRAWPPLLTAALCLVCLLRIGASLRHATVREVVKHPSQSTMPAVLTTSSHVALLSAMLALFVIMQPGHLLPAPALAVPRTTATPASCVETMPGMRMCP
jgi:hypothetical protein